MDGNRPGVCKGGIFPTSAPHSSPHHDKIQTTPTVQIPKPRHGCSINVVHRLNKQVTTHKKHTLKKKVFYGGATTALLMHFRHGSDVEKMYTEKLKKKKKHKRQAYLYREIEPATARFPACGANHYVTERFFFLYFYATERTLSGMLAASQLYTPCTVFSI